VFMKIVRNTVKLKGFLPDAKDLPAVCMSQTDRKTLSNWARIGAPNTATVVEEHANPSNFRGKHQAVLKIW